MIGSGEKDSKVNAIIRAFRVLDRMNRGRPGARQSDTLYYQMMGNYYTRLRNARAEGNFVAAHTVFFPTEIIYSLGLVPMHTELTTWMMSLFLGDAADILSAGAGLGLAPEICTAHRGLAGAFALHALPRPDVMLWSNMLCDNTAKSGELVMEINGCPGFFLDHPYQRSQGEVDYLVDELKDLIAFLEKQSGRKMDWDLLAATVARMDHQIELYRQISQLRRTVPTPFPPQGFLQMLASDYLFPGQPEAIAYLEAARSELADMVARGVGVVAKERFRLMTLFVPPMYLMGFLERISQEYGAVSVVEPFFTHWGEGRLDPSRPLESIARKSYMLPEARMFGPMGDSAIKAVVDTARQYQVDGVIYYADAGCRQSCATIKLFKDVLNGIGLPVLTLDCDVVDPTFISQAEIREKLERFFDLLAARSRPAPRAGVTRRPALGIDIGNMTVKAVLLDGDDVITTATLPAGDDTALSARTAVAEVLGRAGLGPDDRRPVVATGAGAGAVGFGSPPEPLTTCLARGIHHLYPSVRTVIDIGAESGTVIRLNERGDVSDWATHDKCASGTGIFLQQVAKIMQVPLEEMARLSYEAKGRAEISTTCAVFAESEVISHVHRLPPTPREDIVAGIYLSTVRRVISMGKRVGIEPEVAVVGGVALNGGLVRILEEELGRPVIVPESPQTVAALGAAIIARENAAEGDS